MQIQLNGEAHQLQDGAHISDLIEQLGFTGKRIAVELNMEIVPRSEHPSTLLSDGDQVEVVHAIGGG